MNARAQATSRPVILRSGPLGALALLIVVAVLAVTVDFSPDVDAPPRVEGISRDGSLELRSEAEAGRLADPAASGRAGAAAQLRGRAEVRRELSSLVLEANDTVRRPHGFAGDGRPITDGWVGQRVEETDARTITDG